MTTFLQVLLTGLGLGAAYALFAQGVVLIYRGSGIVNFAQGTLGMLASYITFLELSNTQGWPIGVASPAASPPRCSSRWRSSASCCACSRLPRPSSGSSPPSGCSSSCSRRSSSATAESNHPVLPYLPHDTFDWGGVVVQEQVLYIIGVTWW